ncbi:MAG: hypothetical protein R3240_12390, partial [Gammaproteobacteria bacterium]|nr:hypothetical protein [Gammaproteobacteria bacterium]
MPTPLLIFFLSFILAACSFAPEKKDQTLYWPALPETPRLVYETTLRNSESIHPADAENKLQEVVDNAPIEIRQWLIKPYDIAARQGLIVVSDTILSAVHVFDVRRKKLFALGWRGEGKLLKPLGVAIDDDLNIYVADAALKRVIKYDSRGHFLQTIGEPEQFSRIID